MSTTNYNWTPQHPRFLADLNSNGVVDIVGIGPDCVWSSLNGGGAKFGQPVFGAVAFEANAGWRVGDHPRFVVDLNGDGRADILGFGDQGPWTAFGNGDGTFRDFSLAFEELGLSRGWSSEFPRFLADLTGDGKPDIVGFGQDGIWVALNKGDGSFNSPAFVSKDFGFNSGWRVGKHPRFVVDLTGNGHADIVGFGDDGVWIARGNGDGSFQPAAFVVGDMGFNQGWRVETHARFVKDITGNGHPDLIGFGDAGVWVALGNGDGGFQAPQFVLQGFGTQHGWSADKHPRFVQDIAGRGHGDLIGFGDDGVWLSLGNGDGSFQPPTFIIPELGFNKGWRVDDHPRFLADVSGAGRSDIVGFGDDGVWVARNLGDGGFGPAQFVFADFGRRSNHDTIVRKEVVGDHRHPGRIKHVFVLMLENRSFDHMLGFAPLNGTDAATGKPTKADGLDTNVPRGGTDETRFNTFQGQKIPARHGAPDVTVAPGHDFNPVVEQLCGQYAVFESGGPYPEVNNTGFVSNLDKRDTFKGRGREIMNCFGPEDLPILTRLAQEFAVCDRWFSSMPGPTEPNRYFSHAANSDDYDESPDPEKIAESSVNPLGGVDLGDHIFDALDDKDVEFTIYRGDHFPVAGEIEGVNNRLGDTREFGEHFFDDLKDKDFEYSFVHIEPKYFDSYGDLIGVDYANGDSQHPLGSVAAGERLIKKVYEAIRNSPHWESSMLIITYDEHGGFYDHVAPPPAGPTGKKGSKHGFMFDQLGPRVPAVVVSPFVPKGTIEHRLLEHCSIIRTVCEAFKVPLLKSGRDLRQVCGVLHLASLAQARTDTPATLDPVVTSKEHAPQLTAVGALARRAPTVGAIAEDRNAMLAKTLRAAAIRNMALEPERKAQIVERVKGIQTVDEAAAYIHEVEAKIDKEEAAHVASSASTERPAKRGVHTHGKGPAARTARHPRPSRHTRGR
jgi:phospholipase C